jgi:hypothetical protein
VNVVGVSCVEYIRVCGSNLQGRLSLNNQMISLVGGGKDSYVVDMLICRLV